MLFRKPSLKIWLAAVLTTAVVLGGAVVYAQSAAPDAGAIVTPPPPTIEAATEPAVAAATLDKGDTAWLLISTALVMLMTPGLAFFYGGLVRRKNILSIMMQCFMILCIVSLQWIFFGYSLSFADSGNSFIGGLKYFGMANIGIDDVKGSIPHYLFMIFQMMFAVITPALIIGAFAERMRFAAFCVFTVLWATLVYDPLAYWVWGGGFLMKMGALDFAGGAVVHINAGMAALAAALVLGKRQGFPKRISSPHNLPFAILGAALLWFGWFGFNAGSALSANGLAATAFVATHVATAAAGLVWSLLDWFKHGKPTTLGMITGAVAGLVAITPAAGFVGPMGAVAIGAGAGLICWMSVTYMKVKFGYDDSLDAFGVHGVGGMWGAIATGIFATRSITGPTGAQGLLYGDAHQFWVQVTTVAISAGYSFIVSLVLFKLVDVFCKLRISEHDERVGLDLTQHKEAAYTIVD